MNLNRLHGTLLTLSLGGMAAFGPSFSAAAETKSFVVSWFTQAMYSQDDDCPGGPNPTIEEQWHKDLIDTGMAKADADKILLDVKANSYGSGSGAIVNRGRIDGKPVNGYANPQAVKDPNLKSVVGKYAYGFNLDGRGAASPNTFEDPDTHETGVNNQLARALGCLHAFRATAPARSSDWELWWGVIRESSPAWLITLEAADLTKDGDVTITIDRALEHTSKDVNSETRADMTYRIDPGPESHNVFQGKIKNGQIMTVQPGDLHIVGDLLVLPEFKMRQAKMRMTIKPDGKLDAIVGGYQPWNAIYYNLAFGGYAVETAIGADIPGMFHLLRKLADADPDPKTGQNRSISAAWRVEAVPAFTVQVKDKNSKTAQAGPAAQPR